MAAMDTLEQRRIVESLILSFKSFRLDGRNYISQFFTPRLAKYNLPNNSLVMHNLFLYMIAYMWKQLPAINKSSTALAKFRSLLNNDVKFQHRVPVHEMDIILAVLVYFSMLLGLVYIFNIRNS